MQRTLHPDGNRIRTLRLERGWPQEQLANIADLSPRTIQRVEAGGNASFETLRSIASAFEVDARELLKEQPAAPPRPAPKPTVLEAEIAEPEVSISDSGRMPEIMKRGLWAGLLVTAIACLAYVPHFLSRSPDSGGSLLPLAASRIGISEGLNSTQAPSTVLPVAGSAPAADRQIKDRPGTLAVARRPPRQRRTARTIEASPDPVEVSLALPAPDALMPEVATSAGTLGASQDYPRDPQPAERPVEESAAENPVVTDADCDEMTQPPTAGPDPQNKKLVDYRSLSDTAVRFGKRTSGFFSRIGAVMKTSF